MKTLELKDENGKPLPKSWTKSLEKLIASNHLRAEYPDDAPLTTLRNPFTGVTANVTPLAKDLYAWIIIAQRLLPYRDAKDAKDGLIMADWNNARYVFNVTWPEAYYALVD